ncbi:MAG: hypothetical protein KDD44_11070 [Bdellovibrionales bacterium]|nr:hypothetical protein [Bdellovibrionales bacterium]
MQWRDHGIEFTDTDPPTSRAEARRVLAVLRAATPVPEGAKTISDLLFQVNRLIHHLTRHVPDEDEALVREELAVLEGIRETQRNHSTYMWLDSRIGAIKAELGDVTGARRALESAIYESRMLNEPELGRFCTEILQKLPEPQ